MAKLLEQRFKKIEHKDHILKRPDMYIGSIVNDTKEMFVAVKENDQIKIIKKNINYNPGFCKLYSEIITNASDHYIRTGEVKNIKITINDDNIVIENDGPGIPIEIHKEHNIYIPELIFGHLLSGENYDDEEERFVGGLHGIGSKAVNLFSKKFIVETCDGKKYYYQEFLNNMSTIKKPVIKNSKKSYTKITYYPDFERFNLNSINDDIKSLFYKIAIDISAYCQKVKVTFNDEIIPIKNFKDYIKLYLNENSEFFYEKLTDEWEIGVTCTPDDSFTQVSMVNGISTFIGGTHVNQMSNQIIKDLKELLEKKNKNLNLKYNDIKNKLFIFLNTKIANPVFDTQTKENLSLKLSSKYTNIKTSDKFIKQLSQSKIIEDILYLIKLREDAELKKLSKGKTSKVKIKTLDDANKAGTDESEKCVLFITEGLSAAGTILTGFSSTGRDYYGCLPIRGKILNTKKATLQKIKDNDDIKNIFMALGLEIGKKYTSLKDLRYGRVALGTDYDLDGFHIKGLLINLIETFWPELLAMDFIYDFVTPIIKIEKDKSAKFFYRIGDYNKWKILNEKGWKTTYIKGLGTIEANEIKTVFKNLNKHLIKFNYTEQEETKKCIELAFNEEKTNDRKEWLLNFDNNVEIIDKFSKKTTYKSFFDEEFIQFSMTDNIRSIPSIFDGLKPSQRKIIYTALKYNSKEKIKISNFAGSVIENTSYHHGNVSVEETTVKLAQDFFNTNNINLLTPYGNFGSRLKGGDDVAAPRYIFTKLSPTTRYIFNDIDDNILEYLNDDGLSIEPKHYIPIIPMSLVNGADGIGTGWSTYIPKYNPKDIIKYLLNKLQNKKCNKLTPYYNKFKGDIIFDEENNRYISRGVIEKINMATLKITELPIGTWNDKYYLILDKLIENKIIKDYQINDTDENVDIKINIARETLKEFEESSNLIEVFKLETFINFSNMHLFDENFKIKKYNSVYDIIDDFYNIRLPFYQKRKDYIIKKLNYDKDILINKIKFINLILNNKLKINNVKKQDLEDNLVKFNLLKIDDSFNYLLNMSIYSLTTEKILELQENLNNKNIEINNVSVISPENMWINDLTELSKKIK
jgi:DNA topoisomerase-2